MRAIENATARGYRIGTWVILKPYRKARGNNEMDDLRKSIVGQKAIIRGFVLNFDNTPAKDKSGCLLVSIQVCGKIVEQKMIGGHHLSWRLSSLKKIIFN